MKSKHRIRSLGTECGINQPAQISSHVCPTYTVTFVGLEEITAFTLTISYGMFYEEQSIIRHGVVGNRREHRNTLFMVHVEAYFRSTLCL